MDKHRTLECIARIADNLDRAQEQLKQLLSDLPADDPGRHAVRHAAALQYEVRDELNVAPHRSACRFYQ
jgi:hypothetical protein